MAPGKGANARNRYVGFYTFADPPACLNICLYFVLFQTPGVDHHVRSAATFVSCLKPGGAAGSGREGGLGAVGGEGITGIKGLASRELTYRLSFMACSVQVLLFAASFTLAGRRMSVHPARQPHSSERLHCTYVFSTTVCISTSIVDGSIHQCTLQSAVSCAEQRACLQAADVKMGAINIRSEEGVTPESLLAGFSRAEQEEVRSLLQNSLPASRLLIIMYAVLRRKRLGL